MKKIEDTNEESVLTVTMALCGYDLTTPGGRRVYVLIQYYWLIEPHGTVKVMSEHLRNKVTWYVTRNAVEESCNHESVDHCQVVAFTLGLKRRS